ncbi:MAG: MacB family efflux pump subunit, partial [Desulfovibrionaceae bacterium]|nr:MacB family efflux pump subunit [Desulfovibrionaceae bacterium]
SRFQILYDINLEIRHGEFVAIIGQSGSGKSTLMNILGCLDQVSSGSYRINGEDVATLGPNALAGLRCDTFGFIFQRYNLLSTLNAVDNVALPAAYAGVPHLERCERAREILGQLDMGDKLGSLPNQLSGGQQQRVSIGRALMNGGEVILADEPTGALDSGSGEMVMSILRELHGRGHTVILVTHDSNVAAYANRQIEIHDGRIRRDERTGPEENVQADLKPERPAANSLRFYRDQFIESVKMSIQAIVAHKMRSLLTMLGIIIGIASVVSVVALGKGSQERILSDIQSMGTNTINIYPGKNWGDMRSGQVQTLTVDDSDVLSGQSYLDSSTPNSSAQGILTYRNISLSATLNGVGEQYFDVKGMSIDRGRFFTAQDVRRNASVVVIDPNTSSSLFPDGDDPIGKIVIFNKQPLEIIGLTTQQDSVFGPNDRLQLWAPYTTVMNKITGNRHISSITVKVKEGVNSQVAEKNVVALLTAKHGAQDFFTQNTDSIQKTVESTTGTMTLLISCIALISLVVGGIGVMNIMLVSVTERTREIGIRMSIGARQYNILVQFLVEAVLICLIGGITGILFSFLVGFIFNQFVESFAMSFSPGSILVAIGCSTCIGVLFGYMPARNASRLNPIEALARD